MARDCISREGSALELVTCETVAPSRICEFNAGASLCLQWRHGIGNAYRNHENVYKDSNVFENVYKRKETVVEPTNFGGKGRPRLNKALYEYQSGEPSVPDEMLHAVTGNASWQSPGPTSVHLTPLAFRLLLHCVEGCDSPNWRVANDVWRSAFLVVGLVVDRISTSTFHVILTASHYGAWAWQFQEEVFNGVTF